ncbi:MAG: ISKra4 family transposase [Acetobacteraceae bacterium]
MEWTIRLEPKAGWGEVKTVELVRITRPVLAATAADVGLSLAEAKSLMARLQETMVRGQVDEYAHCRRMCSECLTFQPVKDRRQRRLQTLFGTVDVEAPRLRICRCRLPPGVDEVAFSPVSELLPGRCTPELERVQAEVGARASFREGARILEMLLPASPASHVSVRHRLHSTAQRLEAADAGRMSEPEKPVDDEIVVALDGAHARSVPGYQVRHFEAITGKVEVSGRPGRRFAFVGSAAERPARLIRAALADQGWKKDRPVTVLSDGDPALPALVSTAAGGPVTHILDWFHISMRVRHFEQAMKGLKALGVQHQAPLGYMEIEVERLRHLLWNGDCDETHRLLASIVSMSSNLVLLNGPTVAPKVWRFVALCEDLRTFIWNNHDAMIDYGRRWRQRKPIPTSRAESLVNQLVPARMNKRRQMRWSPRGAHRVLQVRAAVLDGRFNPTVIPIAA